MKKLVSAVLVLLMLLGMTACSSGSGASKNVTEKATYEDCSIEIVKCVPQISTITNSWMAVAFLEFANDSDKELSLSNIARVKFYQNGAELTGSVTYSAPDHGIEHDEMDSVLPGNKITVGEVSALSDLKAPILVRVVDFSGNVLCEKEFEIASSEGDSADANASVDGEEDKTPEVKQNWEKSFYVDEFDEPTDEWYVYTSITGTFSNSATTDSNLTGHVLIDQSNVAFMLYEYGRNQVNNIYSRNEGYTITARLSDGSTKEFSGVIYSEGDRIIVENVSAMKELLKTEEKVKFYIYETDNSLTSYLFEVESGNLKDLI